MAETPIVDGGNTHSRWQKHPKSVTKSKSVNGPVKGPVTGADRLLGIIRQNPGLRKAALADLSGLSMRTVKRYVETVLVKHVEFRGAPKTGGYYCK